MGSATGLTADRMLEIEAASVVDGEVVGDDLVLTRHDGTTIDAGNVRGPAGTGGGGGGYFHEQTFVTATNPWEHIHGLGTKGVSVYTEDSSGEELEGNVTYPDDNTVRVTFAFNMTGKFRVFN